MRSASRQVRTVSRGVSSPSSAERLVDRGHRGRGEIAVAAARCWPRRDAGRRRPRRCPAHRPARAPCPDARAPGRARPRAISSSVRDSAMRSAMPSAAPAPRPRRRARSASAHRPLIRSSTMVLLVSAPPPAAASPYRRIVCRPATPTSHASRVRPAISSAYDRLLSARRRSSRSPCSWTSSWPSRTCCTPSGRPRRAAPGSSPARCAPGPARRARPRRLRAPVRPGLRDRLVVPAGLHAAAAADETAMRAFSAGVVHLGREFGSAVERRLGVGEPAGVDEVAADRARRSPRVPWSLGARRRRALGRVRPPSRARRPIARPRRPRRERLRGSRVDVGVQRVEQVDDAAVLPPRGGVGVDAGGQPRRRAAGGTRPQRGRRRPARARPTRPPGSRSAGPRGRGRGRRRSRRAAGGARPAGSAGARRPGSARAGTRTPRGRRPRRSARCRRPAAPRRRAGRRRGGWRAASRSCPTGRPINAVTRTRCSASGSIWEARASRMSCSEAGTSTSEPATSSSSAMNGLPCERSKSRSSVAPSVGRAGHRRG